MKGKRTRAVVTVCAVLLSLAAARPALGLLMDMSGHWAAPLVGVLEAKGIVSGDEDLRYHPEEPLTRAQLAKLLVTGLGYGEQARLLGAYPSRFRDVPTWHWANGYIESLAELGAAEGYGDGTYMPAEQVSRAQLAVLLVRAAGLSEQARLMRFQQTDYKDDRQIPDWARGHVQVARSIGLMEGFEEGTFRPNDPVTRAEGATTLFRLLSLQGNVFHLSGTLVRFDPFSRQGAVRDASGRETAFVMSMGAQYYKSGMPSYSGQMRALDQVWIVLGTDGIGTFMDARFDDALVHNLTPNDASTVKFTAEGNATQTARLAPGALVYLNGRPAALSDLKTVPVAYLVYDVITGEVRVLDALEVSVTGTLLVVDSTSGELVLEVDEEVNVYPPVAGARYVLNGEPVNPTELREGDRLQLVQNQAGAVTYVFAER
jgi:hypothetical protein